MKRSALLLSLAALTLVACAPETGTVKDKHYAPAYTRWYPGSWMQGSCWSYNKNGSCKVRGPRIYTPPRSELVPASTQILLKNGEDEGWREVPESIWQACLVGQTYRNERCEQG